VYGLRQVQLDRRLALGVSGVIDLRIEYTIDGNDVGSHNNVKELSSNV
jgi:hypothetical protein